MDTKFEEGFFNHSFENLYLFNYFFEVSSKWARGQKEILLMSVCFSKPITTQIQHEILVHCIDFANRLKETQHIYKAFYGEGLPSGEFQVESNEQENITKLDKMLKHWIRDLYWNIVSFAREKFEEEIIAELLSQKSIYEMIKYLSNGPVAKEDMKKWFNQKYPELALEEMLAKLETEKFIFQNVIGHDVFVLLVKEVTVQRIPPDCIITLFQEQPELMKLTDEFTKRVGLFFDDYKPSTEDAKDLVTLIANPEIYNVILQLRAGPIPKSQILNMIEREPIKNLMEILNILKLKNIIDDFDYEGESLILLIDDIQFTTSFPDYLSKLTRKKIPSSIAQSYETSLSKRKVTSIESNPTNESGLENLGEEVFNKLKKISKQKGNTKKDE